jgi:two-component system response regulator MprA
MQSAMPDRADDSQRAATILVIDDDEGVTETFARILELEGFGVRVASNAESGLQQAAESRPDAIILDLRMPLVDGLGFLRRLREMNEHTATPVGIVTGDFNLDDGLSAEIRDLGAELCFKPMSLEELMVLTRTLLQVTH